MGSSVDAGPVRCRVVVRGRVQGVFFRASVRERARAAGVAGWVRNRPDGSVEAVFEGTADAVAGMVRYCGHGPEYARVEQVDEHPEEPEGLSGFGVR